MIHNLKTWPEFFREIISGAKKFEVRKNDRNYQVGDTLVLHEFKIVGGFTGRETERRVTYILYGSGQFGIAPGFVVMSLE